MIVTITLDPALHVRYQAAAVTLGARHQVSQVPPEGSRQPGSREALVAGLIPGLVLGWSWPDRLRHAVALAAAAGPSGETDLDSYERLLPAVAVTRC